MNYTVRNWLKPLLSDPEQLNLWACLAFVILVIKYLGACFTPVLLALVVAYLLHWPVMFMQRYFKLAYNLAAYISYSCFIGIIIGLYVLIVPLVLQQLHNLLTELTKLTTHSQDVLAYIHHHYPNYVSPQQLQNLTNQAVALMSHGTQWILSSLITFIPDLIAFCVYVVLVPLLVYFFLIDQEQILNWIVGLLPYKRRLIINVWTEVYTKTGHYVRGKALEILIVWVISAIIFSWMQLPYSMLLGLLTGLSAVVPYVGTVVVAFPIIIVGFLEWGLNQDLLYLVAVYATINFLDSHLLFPFLFAEAMSLHPAAIMIATLVFGGLLGFWGVFFSIPLAVLSNSVFNIIKQSHSNDLTEEQ